MKKIYGRYIENPVREDLENRMVFIGGPRQVGKTTFALTFLAEPSEKHPAYLNWDNVLTRSSLLRGDVVLKEGRPMFAVECKSGERNINPSLFYFMERTPIPKFYQVHQGHKDYEKNGVRVIPIHTFCNELCLP